MQLIFNVNLSLELMVVTGTSGGGGYFKMHNYYKIELKLNRCLIAAGKKLHLVDISENRCFSMTVFWQF